MRTPFQCDTRSQILRLISHNSPIIVTPRSSCFLHRCAVRSGGSAGDEYGGGGWIGLGIVDVGSQDEVERRVSDRGE